MGSVFLKEKVQELIQPWLYDRKINNRPYSSFDVRTIGKFVKDIQKIIVSYVMDFEDLDRYEECEAETLLFFLGFSELSQTSLKTQLRHTRSPSVANSIVMHLKVEPERLLKEWFQTSTNSTVRSVIINFLPKENHPMLLEIVVQQNNIEDLLQLSHMELNVKRETWVIAFDSVLKNQINRRGVSAYLQLYDLISPQDRQRIEREFI